jgi:hypothetical protein
MVSNISIILFLITVLFFFGFEQLEWDFDGEWSRW